MTRDEALTLLIHACGYCFRRGILRRDADFRRAFRELNRAYVLLRDERPLKPISSATRTAKERRRRADKGGIAGNLFPSAETEV